MNKVIGLKMFVVLFVSIVWSSLFAINAIGNNQLTAANGSNYRWVFNGKVLVGCNSQSIFALNNGTYQVDFVDENGQYQTLTKKIHRNKKKAVQLFLIGDSTVADYTLEENYQSKRYPLAGWGQVFQPFFVVDSLPKVRNVIGGDSVIVIDKAKGGRSTRTFFQEGRWREVYEALQPNDLVLMQFGHNDAAVDKTERYVPIEGYKEFLRLFVSQTRQKGALPVLLTPVARNYPWENGQLYNVHGDYPQAVKDVAHEMNVPLIDLNALSMAHFTAVGKETVTSRYFMNFGAGIYAAYPDGQKDNTHFQHEGANAVAQLVFNALQKVTVLQTSNTKR